jgi:putative spermidine/putrescine transport system ATP-binding protein
MSAATGMTETTRPAGARLRLENITHRYGSVTVIDDVTIDIEGGELVAFLGPSGCGKTTLLRIIAGFVTQTRGSVMIGDARVDHLHPKQRQTGIVFQNYALFPHMTVAENVAYGLAARGVARAARAKRVAHMLDLVRMAGLADRFPRQLSGGQQQRVAVARALAVEPRVLLLDESFAALDKNLRLDMQLEIKRIQQSSGTTAILVTHDQEEAMSMADRIAVLNGGRLEQFGRPVEIYDEPASLFVNAFVGKANTMRAVVKSLDGPLAIAALPSGHEIRGRWRGAAPCAGDPVVICVRPENMELRRDGEGLAGQGLAGVIDLSFPLGASIVHDVRLADGETIQISEIRRGGHQPHAAGTPVMVSATSDDTVVIFKIPTQEKKIADW